MCTVTVVPRAGGYRLVCNRDERDDRPPAVPPRRYQLCTGTAIFPLDPASGGTWIAVNPARMTLTVLNRNPGIARTCARSPLGSRGALIPALLGCADTRDVLDAARAIDPSFFEPFRLVAIDGSGIAVVSSDGRRMSREGRRLTHPVLFTSSGLGDARVHGPRRKLFERMVRNAPDSWVDGQSRFHVHRWPGRPEVSVWMRREGARTVSRSIVEVMPQSVTFEYHSVEAGAGCP